jgi:hypothetical protein
MSCDNSCGPLVVTIYTGVPGVSAAQTNITGDLQIVQTPSGATAVVTGIHDVPVSPVNPTPNQILGYDGTAWTPITITAGTY